jgi:hypothetical protein
VRTQRLDWSPKARQGRSRLYNLEPIGVGDAEVEAATSYIARLADAHCVRTQVLVVREILPRLGRSYLSKPTNGSVSAFWGKSNHTLNGTQALARDLIAVLATLTGRPDLRALTMLTWSDILPTRGLLRSHRAWCPACYGAWRATGSILYEPLLWSLATVTACPQHRRILSISCRCCGAGRTQSQLARNAHPGYCAECGSWLGVDPEADPCPDEIINPEEVHRQRWIRDNVGALLAAAPRLSEPPSRLRMAQAIATCVDGVTGGNAASFAALLEVPKNTLWGWQTGHVLPHLEALVDVTRRLDMSLPHLLIDEMPPTGSISTSSSQSYRQGRAPARCFDPSAARKALEAALVTQGPPPSMLAVARDSGWDARIMRRHFPGSCRQVSARYQAYQEERGRHTMDEIGDQVSRAVIQLFEAGVYPTQSRVERLMGRGGVFRHPSVRAVRVATLQRLGIDVHSIPDAPVGEPTGARSRRASALGVAG